MKPPYITSSSASSFAGKTLRKRLPAILKSVIKKNRFNNETKRKLRNFLSQIPYAFINEFEFKNVEEENYWEGLFEQYKYSSWIDLPFYVAEALFYRQILDYTNWYENNIDPFQNHKLESLKTQSKSIDTLLNFTASILTKKYNEQELIRLLKKNLWGNQADLSLFHDGKLPDEVSNLDENLIADDSKIWAQKLSTKLNQIDFLIDNTGVELAGDICLALYLLEKEKCDTINFHIKAAPIFVSDAIGRDVEILLTHIDNNHSNIKISAIFKSYVNEGKIKIVSDFYWNSPLFYNWFPYQIKKIFASSDLVISKGDAHYRRFLQDKAWKYNEPLSTVIDFFDKPLLLLRTLKSEVLAGATDNAIKNASKTDKEWLTNGKFGLIQFHNFE